MESFAAPGGAAAAHRNTAAFEKEVRDLYVDFVANIQGGRLPPDQLSGGAWAIMIDRLTKEFGATFDAGEFFGLPAGTDRYDILRELGYVPATEDESGLWILPDPPPPPLAGGAAGGFGLTGNIGRGERGRQFRSVGRGIGAFVGAGLFNWRISA